MKKKNYSSPALSVEEYEMIIITSTSNPVNEVQNNVGFSYRGGGDGQGDSAPMAKQRNGIWDED